jgi:hypothetical protein
MNERGRDALIQAALAGRPQAIGHIYDRQHGHCALGILADDAGLLDKMMPDLVSIASLATIYDLAGLRPCPTGCGYRAIEVDLIAHLNDQHHWDFLSIAHKLGPEVEA